MTNPDLSKVPFIYDAKAKIGVLRGTSNGREEIVIQLVERLEDDSHTAVLTTSDSEGFRFNLTEANLEFDDDQIVVTLPEMRLTVDPIYVRKFRAFSRGNYPTPDVAGVTLP